MGHTQRRELTIRGKGLCYFIDTLLAQSRQLVQRGVRDSAGEQFIEVKIVPGQEIDSVRLHVKINDQIGGAILRMRVLTYLEEHGLVVDLRTWEHIEAEGSCCVLALTVVPLKCAKTDLEGLEFGANIFQFLIALL